jgi:arylsulfatase
VCERGFNLGRDPFENANIYWDWALDHIFVMYPMKTLTAEQVQPFAEFPPRQKPAAFSPDSAMDGAGGSGLH